MDARILRTVTFVMAMIPASAWAANYRTQNFLITAPTPEFAKLVGDEAERFRKELALEWLGYELPAWGQPCPISVKVGPNLGAGGVTTFSFDRGQVFGWEMAIEGPPDRVVDAVLPHEVTHTIFATHFRRPLPRWADEGACTTVEHESERAKQEHNLIQYLHTDRGIAFSRMFAMKDYPRDILPLYSQGYSLARYLIQKGGRRKFITYLGEGMETENWIGVTKQHYGFEDLRQLQDTWLEWVRQGSPMHKESATVLASAETTPAAGVNEPRVDSQVRPASATLAAAPKPRRANPTEPPPYSRGPTYRAQNSDPTPEETQRLVALQWPAKSATTGPNVERRTELFEAAESIPGEAPPYSPPVPSEVSQPNYPVSTAEEEVDSSGWRPTGPARSTAVAEAPRGEPAPPAAALAATTPATDADPEELEVLLEWSRPAISTARATPTDFSPGSVAPRRTAASVAIPKWPNRPTVIDAPTGDRKSVV